MGFFFMPSNGFDIAHSMYVVLTFHCFILQNVERCMNAFHATSKWKHIHYSGGHDSLFVLSFSLSLCLSFDLFICYTCTIVWSFDVILLDLLEQLGYPLFLFLFFSFACLCSIVARIRVVLYNLYFFICVLKSIYDSNQKQVRSRKPRKVQIQFCFGIVTLFHSIWRCAQLIRINETHSGFGGVGCVEGARDETNECVWIENKSTNTAVPLKTIS